MIKAKKDLLKLSNKEGLHSKIAEALKSYSNSMKHHDAPHRYDTMAAIRQQVANLVHDSERLDQFADAVNRTGGLREAGSGVGMRASGVGGERSAGKALLGAIQAGRQLEGIKEGEIRAEILAKRERELIERERRLQAKELALESLQIKVENAVQNAKAEAEEKRSKDPLYDLSQNTIQDWEAFKQLDNRLKSAFNDFFVPVAEAESLEDIQIRQRREALAQRVAQTELEERERRLTELRRIEKEKTDRIAATLEREKIRVDMLAKQMAEEMYAREKELEQEYLELRRPEQLPGYGDRKADPKRIPKNRSVGQLGNNSSMQISDYAEEDEKIKSISWMTELSNAS